MECCPRPLATPNVSRPRLVSGTYIMSRSYCAILLLIAVSIPFAGIQVAAQQVTLPSETREFLTNHCYDCHDGDSAEAGFDLSGLGFDLSSPAIMSRWVQVFDRVHEGDMPPADADVPSNSDRAAFVKSAGDWLHQYQFDGQAELGRVRSRRLTRREVERSLHDLLGIDIPLQQLLPEDTKTAGFSTVADGQAMSHFQLEQHLHTVDAALDEAFRRALTPPDSYRRDFDAAGVARRNPKRRCREPEMLDGRAVVWSGGVTFYGRLPATTAPADGWYRFRLRVAGLKLPSTGGVWSTVNTGLCISSAPLLTHVTTFEAQAEAREIEFTAWLPKGHMLEIRPNDVTLKKARFAGGQIGTGEGGPQNVPGIAIERLTMERVHRGANDYELQRLLFGDLKVSPSDGKKPGRVDASDPESAAEQLLLIFARRAFRRPAAKSEVAGYLEMTEASLKAGDPLADALRVGYRSLLCSPRFLYLTEKPGPLDDHAIAARLSYFLTGSTPDERLSQLADEGRLRQTSVLQGEAHRLLNEGKAERRFVTDFAAQWLDLDQIDFTEPDRKLFPEFDAIVKHAMLDETHQFLQTLLDDDLPVSKMVDGNFAFLNSRLARYYDIDEVAGDNLQKVSLPSDHPRGGLLTQGAVLKVTANGSNTSPVVRGVWVSERVLGVPIPPPPDNVPAIEPDIRGAKTIREQLAKHRSQQSCAVCHVKIDPPGFALENFDPAGQWRDRYRLLVGGRRQTGAKVDASYTMPDGKEFDDFVEFRSIISARPQQLAENLAEKLMTYGTGAPVSFADRAEIERIAEASAKDDYGFRSILLNVVTSPTFLSK